MKKAFTFLFAGAASAFCLSVSIVAQAVPITGDLFYTKFSGTPNVKKVGVTYDDSGTAAGFVLGTPVAIGTTSGADGITGNPQNSDLLLVGGQAARINTISKSTGTATAYASLVSVYHLEVSDPTTVYGSGIPGNLARHTINPDGSVSTGTLITLSGSNTTITQLISTPTGFYYTSSGAGGSGAFGTLSFTGPASANTTALFTGVGAAHGGVYDPFSGDIMLFGDNEIRQFDIVTATFIATLNPGAGNLDQGTVDGYGHIFVASNAGNLVFVDYDTTGNISSNDLLTFRFLDSALDDIAPLVGAGSTVNPIPEPGTLALFGVGLAGLGLGFLRRRKAA